MTSASLATNMFKLTLVCAAFAVFASQHKPSFAIMQHIAKSAGEPQPTLKLPEEYARYQPESVPAHYKQKGIAAFDTSPDENPITDAGATLGRVLFYDTRFSQTGTVSCNTCHVQENAFADANQFSTGVNDQKSDRNSMALTDLRYARAGLFWDERAANLEEAVLIPLFSVVEVGATSDRIRNIVENDQNYQRLFNDAFGTTEFSEQRIAKALAQFIRSMTSYHSKYDQGAATANSFTEDFRNFSDAENRGKQLFVTHCALCHTRGPREPAALFIMFRSLNNGIDDSADARDGGRGDITFNPTDIGLFKPGSLRNIELTAPYMHDGRLKTLDDVIEHYSSGVARHPTLSAVRRMDFNDQQKQDLVAFLKTLTDRKLTTDQRFSNPFSVDVQEISVKTSDHIFDSKAKTLLDGNAIKHFNTLDLNNDNQLDRSELEHLCQILSKHKTTSMIPEFGSDTNSRLRGGPGRRRGAMRNGKGRGVDFDGDGTVSDKENTQVESIYRLIEMGDGNRLEVMLDRTVDQFDRNEAELKEIRGLLKKAKTSINDRVVNLNYETLAKLNSIIGDENYARYRTLVVNSQGRRQLTIRRQRQARNDAVDRVFTYDIDKNGTLERVEFARLQHEINKLPGGLNAPVPSTVDISQFSARLMQYDKNKDGGISIEEVPERLHQFVREGDVNSDRILDMNESQQQFEKAAFNQIVNVGIYVGGAFDNAILNTQYVIKDLKLDAEQIESVDKLLVAHDEKIQSWSHDIVQDVVAEIQNQK